MDLEKIGFSSWFLSKVDSAQLENLEIARVISVNKSNYTINNGRDEVFAEVTGKLMFGADSPLDYPAVGDWVYAQYFDEDSFAVIHQIFPRKSVLKRKTPGKKIEYQLIAANIDTAFIMQSLDYNYNLRRLERYLVMINESKIRPVVLLSKSDLLSPDERDAKIAEINSLFPDIKTSAFSNVDNSGLEQVKQLLIPGETYCLLGSSGVGKTTLLNNLLDKALFETQEVREKDGKGRHVTARRQLICLESGAMIVDTPGMRELGNISVESGISETFDEIETLSAQCRYNDCSHTQENGCAVLAALEDETISQGRYNNYIKLMKESSYNERSYLEKRRKDKKFGRFVKSVMKYHKKK